jgi:DHA1 family bicyclomycin/chloramphenicol resistance-like MFS transporter
MPPSSSSAAISGADIPATTGGQRPRHGLSFREFVAIAAALMALNALATDIMLPALGDIAKDLMVSDPNERQKVVIVYLLGFGCAQLVCGTLSDLYGRRTVLLAGLVLYTGAAVLSTFAQTMDQLLLSRLVQGIGCAAPRIVAVAMVRDSYSGARMGRVMSLVMMVFMSVPVLAPSVGQAILLFGEWRSIFLVLAICGFILFAWGGARLGETLPAEERRPFSFREMTGSFATVLSTRTSVGYMVALTFIIGALFAFLASAQQVFVETFGLGELFPLVFAVTGISLAASSFFSASVVERIGLRPISHVALAFYMIVNLLQVLAALVIGTHLVAFLGLLILGIFAFGMIGPNFNAIAMEPLGRVAGTGAAIIGFVTTSGGALLGFLVSSQFDGTVLPLTIGFSLFSIGALVAVTVTERGRLFKP